MIFFFHVSGHCGIVQDSSLEVDARECLMKWYGVYHFSKLYHGGVYYDWSERSLNGLKAVHMPVVLGYINILKFIGSYQNNLNPARTDGWTSILLAAANNHLDIVKFLAERTENANAPANDGTTPIDVASIFKYCRHALFSITLDV